MKSIALPNFDKLADFVEWYFKNGKPMLVPDDFEVFLTDDATSSCLFRSGRYQVELYLIHPNPLVPPHEHPGVENIEISSNCWATLTPLEIPAFLQVEGQVHGDSFKERGAKTGFMIMSFQRWDDNLKMSTIGSRWKGHTAGEKHEALIRRFNPNALIYPGYADVTKTNKVADVL